jgi:hypothetical protein
VEKKLAENPDFYATTKDEKIGFLPNVLNKPLNIV